MAVDGGEMIEEEKTSGRARHVAGDGDGLWKASSLMATEVTDELAVMQR